MTTLIESMIGRFLGVVPAIELKVSQQETKAVRQRMAEVQIELDCLKSQLAHVYYGEWKVTKNGKKRYRKVASRFIATGWTTQSESIEPMEMVVLPPPDAVHWQLHGTDTVVTGYADDDELKVI